MAGSSTSAEYGSMDGYLASLSTLDKPEIKIEHKLKAIQDLCSHLESIVAHPCYSSFLARSVASILGFLKAGEPCFISEEPMQQLRKLLLEFLNRIPSKDDLLPYVQKILNQLFEQFTVENEENGLIILKIVVEFHKAFKLSFNTPVLEYVQLLKKIYADFPNHVDKVFQTQKGLKVRDFSTNSLEEILRVTYSSTRIECEGQANEAEKVKQYTLIPRSLRSLRVLTEIPIVVVVLYKVCEEKLYKEIEEFIPIIMELINLESNKEAMKEPSFNKDIHFDFIAVQVKALMFLSYLIRTYEESVSNNSSNF
ncbi:transcription-associated protein 1-like [Stegodyphus dumicola]|uniref:transcription-associated protein 1-like n=1 Tax=Stegodyphus dumicola TaxID=202533 RepID=UPI0015AAFFF2|nr:transcription-associated protein 1-like [Stegodyphus dumicola]